MGHWQLQSSSSSMHVVLKEDLAGAMLRMCGLACRWWSDLYYNSPDLWLEIGLNHTCLIPPPSTPGSTRCGLPRALLWRGPTVGTTPALPGV